MRIDRAILRVVEMPLKFVFRTSFGETTLKRFVLLELRGEGLSGWGECVAEDGPFYSPETVGTATEALTRWLVPWVLGRNLAAPAEFEPIAARVRGHRMAKAAVDMALHDLFAKAAGVSLSRYLGGTRRAVEVGVSLGISPSPEATVENVARHVEQGYRRIKLKIQPGADVERLAPVREAFPTIVLTVDANAAYRLEDSSHLSCLDEFRLDYVEQPLHHEDLLDHAELARRIATPVCLDESIRSDADLRTALVLGSGRVVNVKTGRVGGYLEALRIHERALATGLPLWCGGMLESGVGRAHNVAVASLPGFAKPGDTSSSSRYFDEDLVEPPLEAAGGLMPVPDGPGIGVAIRPDVLDRFTMSREEVAA